MENNSRREFLKKCSLTPIPFLLPALGGSTGHHVSEKPSGSNVVNFLYDGLDFSPQQYIDKLKEINELTPIKQDGYGNGGATKELETEFAKITGKEKAIYLPTGTMANQLAIKLLSEDNTKVFVPENSHVYRDEADASQSVHNKRLVPLGKGKAYFDLSDLEQELEYIAEGEVFKSGIGTVVIENPVRRADGKFVPIETIKEVSTYCRAKGIKLHMDGARIHLASAATNISLKEYSSYFDTIYISLYKYLNAAGGAILCGDSTLIDQVPHQIKIYGGTVYQDWPSASMALHYLNGIDDRWKKVSEESKKLTQGLNKIKETSLTPLDNGTNIYHLKLGDRIIVKDFAKILYEKHSILLNRKGGDGMIRLAINESLLRRDTDEIIGAWRDSIEKSLK